MYLHTFDRIARAPFDVRHGGGRARSYLSYDDYDDLARRPAHRASTLVAAQGKQVVPAASEASLGTKRQFVDIAPPGQAAKAHGLPQKKKNFTLKNKAEKRRLELRERYADQREASRIMWAHSTDGKPKGVTLCGWTIQAKQNQVEIVRETQPDVAPRAFLKNLNACKLGWVCPICTAAKAEESRQKLNALLSRGRRDGWQMVMVTLTVRHDRAMPFDWLWTRLSAASDELRRSRSWRAVNAQLVGSAKAVEATHGAHGWHPHYHVVLVFKPGLTEDEAIAEAETLRAAWIAQIETQGLTGNAHAFQVQGAAAAGNYLAKWGAAEEMSLGHAKQGRKGQRTPWELLRDSRDGDRQAGALWHEFVTAIKGTHQIRLTPGLREKIKEELAHLEAEKERAIEEGRCKPDPEPHQVTLGTVGDEEWRERGRHRRVRIREAAEARTRKEAEKRVWAARHGAETDKDLLEPILVDDEAEPAHRRSDDEPEALLAEHRRRAKMRKRESLLALDAALDEIRHNHPPNPPDRLAV